MLPHQPCPETLLGMDGAYFRSQHPCPQRNFEVIVGKGIDETGQVSRCAVERNAGAEMIEASRRTLQRHRVGQKTTITVLIDGNNSLRTVPAPRPPTNRARDWFHMAMRFENLKQVAKRLNGLTDGTIRPYALDSWTGSNGSSGTSGETRAE